MMMTFNMIHNIVPNENVFRDTLNQPYDKTSCLRSSSR